MGAGAVAAAGAAAIVNAIKASGVLVRVEPEEFSKLLDRAQDPLIVGAEGEIFTTNYQYLMSYKRSWRPLPVRDDPLPLTGAQNR
jgi:hypothetical protein